MLPQLHRHAWMDAEIEAFGARMKELLPEDQAAWLLWGAKGRA